MKIIFDTNVLISAFVFRGVAQSCFELLRPDDFLYMSQDLKSEIIAKFQGGRVEELLKSHKNNQEIQSYLDELLPVVSYPSLRHESIFEYTNSHPCPICVIEKPWARHLLNS